MSTEPLRPRAVSMAAADWDRRYGGAELVWSAEPNVWVRELCGALAPGRALDIAAGEGRNALWLVEQGWDAVATDFSPVAVARMVEIADRRLGARRGAFTAVVADATQPPPRPPSDRLVDAGTSTPRPRSDRLVDAGTSTPRPRSDLLVDPGTAGGGADDEAGATASDLVLLVYLHLPRQQWRAALEAAVGATTPGGVVLVIAHALRNLTEGVGGPQDASILLDPDDVVESAAGLPVDVELSQLRERAVPGADRPALDTVVVFRRRAI
jgi:SAM-dependent methyltransferase